MNANVKGENIYKARTSAKLTMEELGTKIGVSKSTIKKYEDGSVKNIPSDKIEAIAEATGVSCEFLMGWDSLIKENAAFHASILKDRDLLEMIKKYRQLNKAEQETILHMIDTLLLKK